MYEVKKIQNFANETKTNLTIKNTQNKRKNEQTNTINQWTDTSNFSIGSTNYNFKGAETLTTSLGTMY